MTNIYIYIYIEREREREREINYMNNFCYLSSKFVVAAEFKTMSISFHISSLNIESLIPKLNLDQ